MKRRGNVFIAIVAMLGILIFLATYFMDVTRQEKQQTERSHVSTQAQCLAEAALERALGILQNELNDLEKFKDAQHAASWLRAPMGRKGSGIFDSGLGSDAELDATPLVRRLVLRREDLEGPHGDELTQLVGHMVSPGTEFEVEVTIELDKVYSIAPETGSNYLVPGVQIPWNCHSGVKDFFSNMGFVALTLAVPNTLQWLQFNLSFEVLGTTIFSLEIGNLLNQFAEWCNFTAMQQVLEWRTIDKLLTEVLPDSIYPYKVSLDRDIFPPLAAKTAMTLPSDIDRDKHVEKYGMFNIESRGTIVFPTQGSVSKTIYAVKEFKCADVEPPAPMYSFFAANLHDESLVFNDIGGDFNVNNFANFRVITSDPSETEKREFPGLIRVNGTKPMEVNVAFIGNPAGPANYENDSGFRRVARGAEWLLMLNNKVNGVFIRGNNVTRVTQDEIRFVEPRTPVPDSAKGQAPTTGTTTPTPSGTPETGSIQVPEPANPVRNVMNAGVDAARNFIGQIFSSATKPNIMPSSNSYGISLFQLPLHSLGYDVLGVGVGPIRISDPMVKWEWPMAGVGFRYFRVPFPTPSRTVTHFFGDSSLFPTLTREIEGYVLKTYRQWHFCLLSYPPAPIPLGNQIPTPWGIPILPIPFPLWHTHDISDKYGFNLDPLKAPKNESGEVETRTNSYNPAFLENSPPNLYSPEQYVKKSVYYYATAQDFYDDVSNRIKEVNGKKCLNLNGMTYVADSIQLPPPGVPDFPGDTFYVTGRGGIVTGGNIMLNGSIRQPFTEIQEREAGTPRTVFSLICRKGGVIIENGPENIVFEGSLYTDKGIAIAGGRSIRILGNWVTNKFSKIPAQGDIRIEYVAYKTRSSMNSIHPSQGVYDPERYVVSLAPGFSSIRVK